MKDAKAEVREWWIETHDMHAGKIPRPWPQVYETDVGESLGLCIHVIEKSAYLSLEAELAKAKQYDLTAAVLAKDIELSAELEQAKADARQKELFADVLSDKLTAANERAKGLAEALEKFATIPLCPDKLFEKGMVTLRDFAREALLKYKGEGI